MLGPWHDSRNITFSLVTAPRMKTNACRPSSGSPLSSKTIPGHAARIVPLTWTRTPAAPALRVSTLVNYPLCRQTRHDTFELVMPWHSYTTNLAPRQRALLLHMACQHRAILFILHSRMHSTSGSPTHRPCRRPSRRKRRCSYLYCLACPPYRRPHGCVMTVYISS